MLRLTFQLYVSNEKLITHTRADRYTVAYEAILQKMGLVGFSYLICKKSKMK